MSTPWFEDDNQLLEELGLALADRESPSADAERIEMLMVGYDLVMGDQAIEGLIEAALVSDSAAGDLAGVRSVVDEPRLLSYAADGFEIEFELTAGRIVGQVVPPLSGRLLVDQPAAPGSAAVEVAIDDLGGFELELRHPGTFRLRLVGDDGRSVVTGWIDGPHPTAS